jgi:hypothetical protein
LIKFYFFGYIVILGLIDLVAPFGHGDAMIEDLKSVVPGIESGGQG